MIHNIREAFSELLEEVSWMDDKTRGVAREKVSCHLVLITLLMCLLTFVTVNICEGSDILSGQNTDSSRL